MYDDGNGEGVRTKMKFAPSALDAIANFPHTHVIACAPDSLVGVVIDRLDVARHEVRDIPPPPRLRPHDDPPGSGLPREPSDEQAASALRVLMRANATERIDPNMPHAGKDRWQMIEAGRNRNVAHNLNVIRRWWNAANAVDKAAR